MFGLARTDLQQDQKNETFPPGFLEDKEFSQLFLENDEISINLQDNNDMLQQPSHQNLFTVMEPYSQDKGENILTNTLLPLDTDNRSSFIFQAMNWH